MQCVVLALAFLAHDPSRPSSLVSRIPGFVAVQSLCVLGLADPPTMTGVMMPFSCDAVALENRNESSM